MIIINGKTIQGVGNNISNVTIRNGKVKVNGIFVDEEFKSDPEIKVEIHGDVGSIETEAADVFVNGNVNGNIKTMSGDVTCQKHTGSSIKTMSGDVNVR